MASDRDHEFVVLERRDEIAVITFNRPERKNALHPAAHHEMQSILDGLEQDASLRCVILTGAGDSFCAGYDLRDNMETGVMEVAASGFAGLTGRTAFPVPIIAAVNGVAMGGGFETALACDIVLASRTAQFALPEAKVGWSPLAGGLQRLPRIVGEKVAIGLVLTGRTIDALEAERIGIVAQVTEPEQLLSIALDWAQQIAACAPLAIACNREVVRRSQDMPLDQALDISLFPIAGRVMTSEDADEGKRAFFERRPPNWKGR